ncbi:MAG TPA: YXWGXW repeat-containing protein, partial [Puia sp.]
MKRIEIILTLTLGLFVLSSASTSAQVSVGISISANIAPPPLPVYSQPLCPTDGFLWVPGYWAYGDGGYFWVPGVWVRPPQYGYLWTPAYWGYAGGIYGFHYGYWGPHIGFYGGINYGYGYSGSGFYGGRWEGNSFRYNTAVVNVNTKVIHNTYNDRTVIVNNTRVVNNRASFNGGPGGISARPTTQEESALRERHVQATSEQTSHMQHAMQDRNQFASVNHGRPVTTAMSKPGGSRYDPHGNVPVAHPSNNQPAVTHNPNTRNNPA